jgi:septal ring factor EnvC (AmiA/AmiB activator)
LKKKTKTHLKASEGKTKSEQKKVRQEYEDALKRLEKKQSKYMVNENRTNQTISRKEKKRAEAKRMNRYNDRVWPGWRETDGKKAPVKTYRLEGLKDTNGVSKKN